MAMRVGVERLFWGKTDQENPDSGPVRPLWVHLLDVAVAAFELWEFFFPANLRRELAARFNMGEEETGKFLSFWIGLHDTGKAIPGFQSYHSPSRGRLEASGLRFPLNPSRLHHGHASIVLLQTWLRNGEKNPIQDSLEDILAFVGFHHGRLWLRKNWKDIDYLPPETYGGADWRPAQIELIELVARAWNFKWPSREAIQTDYLWRPEMLAFAGWTTLADWVASMEEHYSPVSPDENPEQYLACSRANVLKALASTGLKYRASLNPPPFAICFPAIDRPRALQSQAIELKISDKPSLTIIEAPTGEGKTEAAAYLAARQQAMGGAGLYMAMPTQATSNELFTRMEKFLAKAHSGPDPASMRLVHGNAAMNRDQQRLLERSSAWKKLFDDEQQPGESAWVQTAAWFMPRKRSLLAPYGVGTVDQAFLGVLYARHFFLRLLGLGGKTVIFDEVHAYDHYMNRLFLRLLLWLRALGANVIILSATLPVRVCERLIAVWSSGTDRPTGGRTQISGTVHKTYPALWHVEVDRDPVFNSFPTDRAQTVRLRWTGTEPADILESVQNALNHGATVGIVLNTVARAQNFFDFFAKSLVSVNSKDQFVFHARYPLYLRAKIERRVKMRFGKKRPNCQMALLTATQVIEQSLDLDFDVLFSDFAPVDLLLQRAGRLHRHERLRPQGFTEPVLYILSQRPEQGELPDISAAGGGVVYDSAVLYRTFMALRERKSWFLPADYRILIEFVYGSDFGDEDDILQDQDLSPSAREKWRKAVKMYGEIEYKAENEAARRLIPSPDSMIQLVTQQNFDLVEEEDARVHESMRALTRLGDSIDAVCLHRGPNGCLYVDANIRKPLNDKFVLRALAWNGVRIGHRGIMRALREMSPESYPPEWLELCKEHSALRFRYPLVFENGLWSGGGYSAGFDEVLGLVIKKEERAI